MTVRSNQFSVTTSATRLGFGASLGDGNCSVLIRNRAAVPIYVGGSSVTTATGVQVDPGESLNIDLGRDEALFGVASSTAACHVIQASGN